MMSMQLNKVMHIVFESNDLFFHVFYNEHTSVLCVCVIIKLTCSFKSCPPKEGKNPYRQHTLKEKGEIEVS